MDINIVKKYWDKRPCNIKHSDKPVGSFAYFTEVEQRKYMVEPHIPIFAGFDKWHIWEGKKVLECGCGLGTDSINFVRSGAKLTCIELSEESLNMCKQRFDVFGLKARFYQGNAEELSSIVPIEEYDLIYSFGVIHHTPNPERVFEEIKKYMGPKTEVRIMMYSKYSWKTLENYVRHGWRFGFSLRKTIQYFAEAQPDCPVAYVYSKKELQALLSDFEIVDMRKDHIFPYEINDYLKYKYTRRFIFRIMPRWFFKWLESVLGWHWLVTFKLKNQFK